MKIRLVVIGVRPWEKVDPISEERIEATFVQYMDEKGKPGEFRTDRTPDDPMLKVHQVMKFDQALSQEFDLYAKYDSFKQKMKFAEVGHDGAKEE